MESKSHLFFNLPHVFLDSIIYTLIAGCLKKENNQANNTYGPQMRLLYIYVYTCQMICYFVSVLMLLFYPLLNFI